MNAGILTIYGLNNYGNRLQNYAVSSALLKLGVNSETLVPLQWSKTPYRQRLESDVRKTYCTAPERAQAQNPLIVREFRYRDFNETYIPERYLDEIHFHPGLAEEYDFFVTGSDQVWNPQFRDSLGQLENRLLSFAKSSQRVCFAPSIGIDQLDVKWHNLFHREWNKFPYLNVREESGAEIIRQITGRDAEVVLDPTFMIGREEWLSLAKPLPGFDADTPFVLYYFLGDEQEEIPHETRELMDEQFRQHALKEHRLLDKDDPVIRSAGPSEFLWLFSKASLICTDSFHGTVFSILMGKPFVLFNRQLTIAGRSVDMSNRTISLLQKLQMTNKLPGASALNPEKIWDTDYSAAHRIIRREQERMNDLLKNMMRLE